MLHAGVRRWRRGEASGRGRPCGRRLGAPLITKTAPAYLPRQLRSLLPVTQFRATECWTRCTSAEIDALRSIAGNNERLGTLWRAARPPVWGERQGAAPPQRQLSACGTGTTHPILTRRRRISFQGCTLELHCFLVPIPGCRVHFLPAVGTDMRRAVPQLRAWHLPAPATLHLIHVLSWLIARTTVSQRLDHIVVHEGPGPSSAGWVYLSGVAPS